MTKILESVNQFVWGLPALVLIIGVGIRLSLGTGFAQITLFPKAFRLFVSKFRQKRKPDDGVTAYQALCTALAATVGTGNIAGVTIPTFEGADFSRGDYDLYVTPLWVDLAANHMEKALMLDLEAEVLDEQVRLLERELLVTSQRVNLFEKVKIPETLENIKKISIYLADQQVSAVVRSKISKRKLAVRNVEASEKEVCSL